MDLLHQVMNRNIISGSGGGGGVIEPITINENGVYTATQGVDGYSPVTVNVTKTLPAEYQEVEYIEATGTQYLLTPIIGAVNYSIDCKFYTANPNSNYLYGQNQNGGNWMFNGLYSNDTLEINGTELSYTASNTIEMSQETNGYNYQIEINGTTYSRTVSTDNNNTAIMNLLIFAAYRDNGSLRMYTGTTRCYYFTAKYIGAKILELVPCYRKSDNVIGMYDLVSDTFLTNAGSGNFGKGPDVN